MMASETNLAIVGARGVRSLARSALENVVGFILPIFVLTMIGGSIRWVAEQLDQHTTPWVALAFIGLCALAWLGVLTRVTPSLVRGSDGRIRSGFVVGFAAAASMVWVYIFAVLSYLLLKLGAVPVVITAHPDAPLSDLLDAYTWYFLDLIPLLEVNEALGWLADVDLKGGWAGVVLLMFRVVIVFQVFAFTKRLLKASAGGKDDS